MDHQRQYSMGQVAAAGMAAGNALRAPTSKSTTLVELEAHLAQLRERQHNVIARMEGLVVRAFGTLNTFDAGPPPPNGMLDKQEPNQVQKLFLLHGMMNTQVDRMNQILDQMEQLV